MHQKIIKAILFVLVIPVLMGSCIKDVHIKNPAPDNRISRAEGISLNPDSIRPPQIIPLDSRPAPRIIQSSPPIIKTASPPSANFINFNTEQGLALSGLFCGLMDSKGNLWFGTNGGGVSRFDGKSFTTFSTAQGLPVKIITAIKEDKLGNLWFATSGGGISRYDGRSFTTFTTAQGLNSNSVLSIAEDKNGNLWFGTSGDGVSRYDGKSFSSFRTEQGLVNNFVRSILKDKNGNLWFGTANGVSRYDGSSFTTYTSTDGLAQNTVKCIVEDRSGNLWFGTEDGVSRFDGKSFSNFTTLQGLASNDVLCSTEDKSGNLWFGTQTGGVSRFDGKFFSTFTTAQGLANNLVVSITEDKSGNLWFGTGGGGVSCYSGKTISTFTTQQGLPFNSVWNITEDKKGNLWFGTKGGGVSRYDGRSFITYTTKEGLAGNIVPCIKEDSKGNLWFGTSDNGVSRFDGKTFTAYTTRQGLVNNAVRSITEDDHENLWFSGGGREVSRFDGKAFTIFTSQQGLANSAVNTITKDKNGNLWFCTDGGGVSRFDGSSFTTFTTAQGLANDRVTCGIEDRSGILWFGTFDGGLSRYDGQDFLTIGTAQGLADNVVYDIVEDSAGVLWIGTNLGFSGLRFQSLKDKDSGENPSNDKKQDITGAGNLSIDNEELKKYLPVWEFINNKTGYPVKDLNSRAMCITKTGLPYGGHDIGIIWGGCGDDKVIRFEPGAVNKNLNPLTLAIQRIQVNEENICWYELGKKKQDSIVLAQQEIMTHGELLMSQERENIRAKYAGICFDSIGRFDPVPVNLVLPYRHNNISFDYTAIEPLRFSLVSYRYMLEGYDKHWSRTTQKTSVSYGNINEGTYTFRLKALSPEGVESEIGYPFTVLSPWWRTWWAYSSYLLLFIIALITFTKWRERTLRSEKVKLEKKVEERTNELKSALEHLKSTQSQLIHSEKMASLGELTAGIAHEIQNPLNFVNNFADVNSELIAEMKQELDNGKIDDAKAIANNIDENEQKIIFHGKRADAIVKGMLMHSRSSSGVKEPTDINALADEYLRLAYHGLRAKDKSFNATMLTDYDESIGLISIVPQDIGRVILNLITNAFYAVSAPKSPKGDFKYEPTVTLTTKRKPPSGGLGAKVEISVKDNGSGIPKNVLDKIFQPFFTTKPTGQGTGLGLSLSYDIIKAHGGELKVETKEGEGSEFIIILPQ